MYLAITQATCEWLLARSGLLDAVHQDLVVDPLKAFASLSSKEFVTGSVRIAGSPDKRLIGVWNKDYLIGTGEEPWGFIRLLGPYSLSDQKHISREVLERSIYVVNQRLQGLLIDGAFIHRSQPNGAHTCLSGRGSEARQFSIGYYEERLLGSSAVANAIVIVGPEYNFSVLAEQAKDAGLGLASLSRQANSFLLAARTTPVLADEHFPDLRASIAGYGRVANQGTYDAIQSISEGPIGSRETHQSIGRTYREWLAAGSSLSPAQRKVIDSKALEKHPLRILGPAGSGKTVLMQLLALQSIETAHERGAGARVLYLVHNAPMVKLVAERFDVLDPGREIRNLGSLEIETLSAYAIAQIGIGVNDVVDKEAQGSKEFQLEEVRGSMLAVLSEIQAIPEDSVFKGAMASDGLMEILSRLVSTEVSMVIKGHGLENDRKRYVESERRLSRLHGALRSFDRDVLFDIFEEYRRRVFNGYGVLDSDDVAISLLGQLRTPVWELRRKDFGFDFIFVDETQMFNDNERRVFPLLSSAKTSHVPIALALDEAQDPHGVVASGMATLGIEDAASESLGSIHRSTPEIVALAFFLIQQTTDLFGVDFPDFTRASISVVNHVGGAKPRIETASTERLGKSVLKRIRELRAKNIWRIAVVCFSEHYFDLVKSELEREGRDLPRFDLLRRGERLPIDAPVVVLTRPEFIGGQEFDAVVAVGLEQGIVPPRVVGNAVLAAAIEQQLLRELYVAVSRARERVIFVLSVGAVPTQILVKAVSAGLVDYDSAGQRSLALK
jgi:hypothetical protein